LYPKRSGEALFTMGPEMSWLPLVPRPD